MKNVLIVGDKPSRLNSDNNKAFVGARCYPRLLSWISNLEIDGNYQLINRIDQNFELEALIAYLEERPIIALGNNASKALNKMLILHFKMDHPSGLNRNLNSEEYVNKKLKECIKYLYDQNEK